MSDSMPPAFPERVRLRGENHQAEPGWFGPEDRPRFGWLYRPDRPIGTTGIVIVPPFGYEAICVHRSMRHLAEDAAQASFVVLRFDLDGTGDSVGSDADPDRVGAWIASIHDACEVALSAGATQLVLVGVRLGATLAMLAAAHRKDVAGLVAINAVISGKAFLREGRALQAAMALQPEPSGTVSTGQELAGFEITDETSAALLAIDLMRSTARPAPSLLLIERDDMPPREKLAEHLRTLGAEVMLSRLPGYVDMMRDPMNNVVAQDVIDASIDFAKGIAPLSRPSNVASEIAMRGHIEIDAEGTRVVEQVLITSDQMFAIVSRPAGGETSSGAVLLLTVGALLHVGPNRMYVPLARRLARAGFTVLRVDLSGIGESKPRVGVEENVIYGPHAIRDAGRWIEFARKRLARPVIGVGVCSGSYHALRAAIRGRSIDTLLLINPVVLRDSGGHPLFLASAPLLGNINHYKQAMKRAHSWRKLLRGQVAFGDILEVVTWHVNSFLKRCRNNLAHRFQIFGRDDLGGELQALAERGVAVHFLFSTAEQGRTVLAIEAGAVVRRLCRAGKFSMRLFEGSNHTFTQCWAQQRLQDELMKIVVESAHGFDSKNL